MPESTGRIWFSRSGRNSWEVHALHHLSSGAAPARSGVHWSLLERASAVWLDSSTRGLGDNAERSTDPAPLLVETTVPRSPERKAPSCVNYRLDLDKQGYPEKAPAQSHIVTSSVQGGAGGDPPASNRESPKSPMRGGRTPRVKTPFGRKLHWVDPSYSELGRSTVFSAANRAEEELDQTLLASVFGDARSISSSRRNSCFKADKGIQVLNVTRAQHMAIMFSRLSVSTEDLCDDLKSLDFISQRVRLEDVELALGKLPTASESKQLLEHVGHAEELRDVERKLLPICMLQNAEVRLKLFHTALTHTEQFRHLLERFRSMQEAAAEVVQSERLHALLRMVLKVANFINHGGEQGAKALPVRSLRAFASFRVGGASALHYLCLTLCSAAFLRDLRQELAHMPEAARESSVAQHQDLLKFRGLLSQVEQQVLERGVAAVGNDPNETDMASADSGAGPPPPIQVGGRAGSGAQVRVNALLASMREELADLEHAARRAAVVGEEAMLFCGESSGALPPVEDFYRHIADFLELLLMTSVEIQQNPKRWHRCLSASRMPVHMDNP